MNKKLIFGIFLTLIFGVFGVTNVNAKSLKTYDVDGETLTYDQFKQTLCHSEVGEVKIDSPLQVGDKDIELYCTFANKKSALKELNSTYSDAINLLAKTFNLPKTITDSNWQKFRNAINSISETNTKVSDLMALHLSMINSFFDIYENDTVNEEISSLVNEYNKSSVLRSAENNAILQRLDEIVPNYSDNFGTITPKFANTDGGVVPMVGSSLNVARATAYATAYATSPNTSSYHYFSNGDCTNFMSQILEYSGVSQIVYDSEYSGWWHKKSTTCVLGICWDTHTHSRSWTMADTFSRYMGVTVSTTNILTWSADLKQGDFIALDFTNDGSWDHMGYVTDTSGVLKSYEPEGANYCIAYYNFRVAQHTGNYHEWTSNSKNSWETYVNGRYGRIRG